jgi:hypothetical protein
MLTSEGWKAALGECQREARGLVGLSEPIYFKLPVISRVRARG